MRAGTTIVPRVVAPHDDLSARAVVEHDALRGDVGGGSELVVDAVLVAAKERRAEVKSAVAVARPGDRQSNAASAPPHRAGLPPTAHVE
jgi:hypothetical protein